MTLDEILRAQPATLPPPPPRREHKRFDYTGWHQRHPVEQVATDPLHELIGAEYFDPEPEPPRAPQVVPEGMHMIGDVARALGREPRTIRLWIRNKTIPEAATRTVGREHAGGLGATSTAKRLWPADEINAMVEIAREEGVIDRPHAAWNQESNFRQRVWDAVTALRAGRAAS
jgi:hypothetical protein